MSFVTDLASNIARERGCECMCCVFQGVGVDVGGCVSVWVYVCVGILCFSVGVCVCCVFQCVCVSVWVYVGVGVLCVLQCVGMWVLMWVYCVLQCVGVGVRAVLLRALYVCECNSTLHPGLAETFPVL